MPHRLATISPKYFASAIVIGAFLVSLIVGLSGARVGDTAWPQLADQFGEDGTFSYVRDSEGGRPPAVLEAYRPPGFPFLLSLADTVFGERLGSPILEALLVALICALVISIGRALYGWAVGLTAGAVMAAFPYTLFHYQSTMETPLFTAALLGLIACALFADRRPMLAAALITVCATTATLTRPLGIVAVLVVLGYLVLRRNRATALAGAVGVAGLVGAWCVYVASKVGAPTFVSTNGGWNLWLGNNEQTLDYVMNGRSLDRIEFDGVADMSVVEGMSESEEASYFQQRAIEWVTSSPLEWLKLAAVKAGLTVLPIAQPLESSAKAAVFFVSALPFYVGAAVQAVKHRSAEQWLLVAIVLQAVAMNVLTLPYTRTLAPVFPILIVMGCAFFVPWLVRTFTAVRTRRATVDAD